jgi:hypothetical protein
MRPHNSSWFRFVPKQFNCPHCGVHVRPIARPLGRVILAFMVVSLLLSLLATSGIVSLGLTQSRYYLPAFLAWVCFALALCYGKWGITFKEIQSEQDAL